MMTSRLLAVSIVSAFSLTASAATTVQLGPQEIDAAKTLIKPELTSVLFDGDQGNFLPGSTLQFLGVDPTTFKIDFGSVGDLADVHFDHLEVRGLNIGFEKDHLRVEISITDREKGIRSTVGGINFKGVSVVAWVKASDTFAPDGSVLLSVDNCVINGEMKGTGLIGSGTINKLKSQVIDQVKGKVTELLAKPNVRDAIDTGILKYAKFSQLPTLERYVPGSLKVDATGISYQAE